MSSRVDQLDQPEALTTFFDRLWRERARDLLGSDRVPPCPYSADDIREVERRGGRIGYLPPRLASRSGRHLLGLIFPEMRCFSLLADNQVDNEHDHAGWFDYACMVDAPMNGLDEADVRLQCDHDGTRLLTLNEYIVASQDHRLFTGSYLDEYRTWARIGSRLGDRLIAARFDGPVTADGLGGEPPTEGCLLTAYDVAATDRLDILGARATVVGSRSDSAVVEPASCIESDTADRRRERTRILRLMLDLGFHTELELSQPAYVASIPLVGPSPDPDRFSIPLIVETRIGWRRQAQLAAVELSQGTRSTEYVAANPRWQCPTEPYVAWCAAWDQRFAEPIAGREARSRLSHDEIGGSPLELVAMHIAHPELGQVARYFEAIGYGSTSVSAGAELEDSERLPSMYYWRGHAEIGAQLHHDPYPIFRPLVRAALD